MTTMILVRHGESEANLGCYYAGHLDAALTEKGLLQAKCTAKYIKENYKVDKVYASDLRRAFVTGKTIADVFGLDVTVDSCLREIDAGEWDGVLFEELKEKSADYRFYLKDIGNSKCTGGESVAELQQRISKVMNKIAAENDGKVVVVATHATPIRTMQCLWSGKSLDDMKNIPWVANASVTVASYDNGKWTLVAVGESAHLKDLLTKLPENV